MNLVTDEAIRRYRKIAFLNLDMEMAEDALGLLLEHEDIITKEYIEAAEQIDLQVETLRTKLLETTT